MSASEIFPGPGRAPVDSHLVANPSRAGINNATAFGDSAPKTHVEVLGGQRRRATRHEATDSTYSPFGGVLGWDPVLPLAGPDVSMLACSARCSIACGADLGTVVVTVHGELDGHAAAHLGAILGDLIEFEGDRRVVVDLGPATVPSPAGVAVFAVAAQDSYNHGGTFTLTNVPAALGEALQHHGLDDIVSGRPPASPGLP